MEPRTMLYDLSEKLTYTKSGDFEETFQIEIDAPSFNTFAQSTLLAQAFTKALLAQRQNMTDDKQDDKAEKTEIGAAEIKLILFGANTDFNQLADAFVDLCSKAATLDQERKVRMRKDHFVKMAYDDVVGMLCQYIATFTVPSVLSGLQSTEGRS